ncbi:NRG1 [[Candida] subhashii]|uniref:NRG1 n=1 Tax=[Candida] subhashii TaxID=561895 RepID=A0A8J5UYV9_9ASCO|nr:NRG1 [[Candida] subhashii]KAG7663319.1 NRG1 [[Candida] subhashii]
MMLFSSNCPTTAPPVQQTPPNFSSRLDKMKSPVLPSFNELLTSIPLPHEFKQRQQQQAVSQAPSPVSTSPTYNYYVVSSNSSGRLLQSNNNSVHYVRQPTPDKAVMQTSPLGLIPIPAAQPLVSPAYSYQSPHYGYYQGPHHHGHQVVAPAPAGYHYQVLPGAPQVQLTHSPQSIDQILEPKIRSNSLGSTSSSSSTSSTMKDPKRKHVCKVCSRSFTTSGHLARHNRIHTGERKHVCPWPTCTARFARQDNCMQHYKTHTNGKNKRSKMTTGIKGKLSPKAFV